MFGTFGKILVTGVGFMQDAYDLFIIGLVLVILKDLYKESVTDASLVANLSLVGAIFGQLTFGFLADRVGRVKMFVVTLSLIIIGAIGSSAAFHVKGFNIFHCVAMWRLIMGIGIGGEYPLSATISREKQSKKSSSKMTAAVFSMQGIGYVVASIVIIILLESFKHKEDGLTYVWRIALAFGGVPGLFTLYPRIKMHESAIFEKAEKKTVGQQLTTVFRSGYLKRLIGTAGSWLIFDIVFYGNGIFGPTIIDELNFEGKGSDARTKLLNTAIFSLIVYSIGLVGYYLAIYFLDIMGRKTLQILGFLAMALLYLLMGLLFDDLIEVPYAFLFIYGLTFLSANFGPNMTTFVIPTESFPTAIRSTCHGISAASGKLGAVIGASMMKPLLKEWNTKSIFLICAILSGLGVLWTLIFTEETKDVTLEDIERGEENATHPNHEFDPTTGEVTSINESRF